MTIGQKEKADNLLRGLGQFTGTTQYYRYSPLFPRFLLTDGTRFLAEQGECFWLMDQLAIAQKHPKIQRNPDVKERQFWKLKVRADRSALLICERDTDDVVHSEEIPFTDFPLESIDIWVQATYLGEDDIQHMVALLPSEY